MSNKKFIHLHVHTEYSLLDGLSNLKQLVSYVKEKGMDSIAITDHGAMYGVVDFYQQALKGGVKPIIGIEAYTTNVNHKDRPERKDFQNFHLLLLAKDKEGYQNLMHLTSIAHLEGYYYRPRFDKETLAKYAKGLICASACAQGEVAQKILEGDFKKAQEIAKWHQDIFGKDYYLEIQRHRYAEFVKKIENPEIKNEISRMAENEETINKNVVKISRELGIPLVATNDAHYIRKEDASAQDALLCIATGKNVSDVKRLRMIDAPTFYVAEPDEMHTLFKDLPEACENTIKIAEKCNLEIALGKWFFPKFPLPNNLTPDEFLRQEAKKKLKEKISNPTQEIKERLKHELEIIIQKGYAPYFLIVMDMVNWANEKGIITNTRGSAAGSLVSYVLGITTVNPLTYDLPFERFLNPFRPSPPDIDFDVSDNRRDEIIRYICDKYGHEKVAQICTFGRMLARGAVRDVARVLGYPYATGDKISKLIPIGSQGFPMTIEKALGQTPELKEFYNTDPDAKKIIDLAQQIEGTARHISVHAAGVVVAPTELIHFTPIQLEPSGDKVITQYEWHTCENVGLIKFDILGIRNLSILGSAIEIVGRERKEKIDLNKIPLNDKKTFEMLSKGETMGVFQLGGSGMTRYLKDLKPNRIEDLMAMVALYRPGPMSVIPEYIARKHNPSLVKYLDPRMKKFLDKTYGLIVYQDDLLFCALELAGYSWEEADKFRKAVGKKIPEEMAAQKDKFIGGIIKNGQTQEFAEELWKLFEPFQSYGFNKAHAASYGMVAYQTAYMKANFPVEYMTALLTAESGDAEKISTAINECRRMNVEILPPDINESDVCFTIVPNKDSLEGKAIRFGLSAIKNVGNAAIEAILSARKDGQFISFPDFLKRADSRKVNKKVLESLIKVGALSSFGSRAALLTSLDEIRNKVTKPKGGAEGQQGLFTPEDISKSEKIEVLAINENVSEFSDDELQALERQLLGFSLSGKPVGELIGALEHQSTHKIFEISSPENVGEKVRIAAVVREVRVVITKKTGSEMAFVKVDDGTGTIDLVVFPKLFQATREIWIDFKPLLISGRVDLRDETSSLIVEAIETLEGLDETKEKEVFIRIPGSVGKDELAKLKDLLLGSPGDQTVYLIFEGKETRIKLPFKISWNELLAHQITEVLEGIGLKSVQ
jgi:DNA polymerase-3 subunit alpha